MRRLAQLLRHVVSLLRLPALTVVLSVPPWPSRPVSGLRAAARRGLRSLGWPGALGAALLAACPALYLSAVQPAQQRLEAARQEALAMLAKADRGAGPAQRQLTPAEQLEEFYRLFPAYADSPRWLGRVFAVAQQVGLGLEQGEYRTTREGAGRLVRLQITLPVKGQYPQIRRFLAGLRSEVPAISLEHVQFERQKVGDPAVEAKIKLALYLEQRP